MLDAIKPLGNEYVFVAKQGMANRWIPIGGQVRHNALRARLLYGLQRRVDAKDGLDIHYLMVLSTLTTEREMARAKHLWKSLITDETRANFTVDTVLSDDVAHAIFQASADMDLLVLGLNKSDPKKRVFGRLATKVVQKVRCAVVVIGQRGVLPLGSFRKFLSCFWHWIAVLMDIIGSLSLYCTLCSLCRRKDYLWICYTSP